MTARWLEDWLVALSPFPLLLVLHNNQVQHNSQFTHPALESHTCFNCNQHMATLPGRRPIRGKIRPPSKKVSSKQNIHPSQSHFDIVMEACLPDHVFCFTCRLSLGCYRVTIRHVLARTGQRHDYNPTTKGQHAVVRRSVPPRIQHGDPQVWREVISGYPRPD